MLVLVVLVQIYTLIDNVIVYIMLAYMVGILNIYFVKPIFQIYLSRCIFIAMIFRGCVFLSSLTMHNYLFHIDSNIEMLTGALFLFLLADVVFC